MDFGTAINKCFKNYAQFQGRATRREFWFFILFGVLILCATVVLDRNIGLRKDPLSAIAFVVLILPIITVGTRRLHDTNKSGWWQLICFVPIVGIIALLILLALQSDPADNRFGAAAAPETPKAAVA